jgi:hypothetical protein
MKHILFALLLTAPLYYQQERYLTMSLTGEFVLNRPDLKPIKGMIIFEKGIEQYGIKIDSNYYFVRCRSLIPVKKEVKGFRQFQQQKSYPQQIISR